MYTREKPRKLTLSTKLHFGKYKDTDKNVYTLIKEDVKYCEWLLQIWEGEIDVKVKEMIKSYLSQ